MRPPKPNFSSRRLKMIRQLQSMCKTNLAQNDNDMLRTYDNGEYRQIILALDKLISRWSDIPHERFRLRHLERRLRTLWSKLSRAPLVSKKRRKALASLSKPRNWNLWRNPLVEKFKRARRRAFAPYGPKKRAGWVSRGFAPEPSNNHDLNELLPIPLEEVNVHPADLTVRLPVSAELGTEFHKTHPSYIDAVVQLRMILASSGFLLPALSFTGCSMRLEPTIALEVRGTESSSYHALRRALVPVPRSQLWFRPTLSEGLLCLRKSVARVWPLLPFGPMQQCLLHLSRVIQKESYSLISRTVLLEDLEETPLPSRRFKDLAAEYLETRGLIPKGSFLELHLQILGETSKTELQLPVESQDLPVHAACSKNPLLFFEGPDIIYLALCEIGNENEDLRQQIRRQLSPELQQKLEAVQLSLGPDLDSLDIIRERFAQTKAWQETFGNQFFSLAAWNTLLDRLLQSEKSVEEFAVRSKFNWHTAKLKDLARKDPIWLAHTLFQSYLWEGPSPARVLWLAKKQPARLVHILENFWSSPPTPYHSCLDRLSILCQCLGTEGSLLKAEFAEFLPPLRSMPYSDRDTKETVSQAMRRIRWWAVRGVQTDKLQYN